MKRFRYLVFWLLLLFTGCSTFVPLTKEQRMNDRPKNTEAIRVTLKDGTQIVSGSYRHIETKEPADLVIGEGLLLHQRRGTKERFRGNGAMKSVDSTGTDSVRMRAFGVDRSKRSEFLLVDMPDSVVGLFRKSECLVITSDQQPGFWCIGKATSANGTSGYHGSIPMDEIQTIAVQGQSGSAAAMTVLGACLFIMVGMAVGMRGMKIM